MPEPRHLVVARILRPHGIRGEVRAEIITSYPELLASHDSFFLSSPRHPEAGSEYEVERVRLHSGLALIKFQGCEDRNAAEGLRGMLVHVATEKAVPLDEGEYYLHQIIGLRVETRGGTQLGRVSEVLETGADDVYVVRGTWGEILLPATSDVVRVIDVEAGRMEVEVPPGLLQEDVQ